MLSLSMKQDMDTIAIQEAYAPIRIMELELSHPLPTLYAVNEQTGQPYQRARCLVRLHSKPLGTIELPLTVDGLRAEKYTAQIWQQLGEHINAHLHGDGLPAASELTASGLTSAGTPRCLEERERFYAQAPFVSVIVPTHDRPERIQLCLRSLLSLHYPRFEIIVVDNVPSTTATADFFRQAYHDMPQVRYLRENRPGRPWALNCGIRVAEGEILAFVDDDEVVDPNWLVELVRGFSQADDVVCVTGLVLPLELETPAQFWLEEYGGFSKGFKRQIFDLVENRSDNFLYPYTAGRLGTGGNMAFTRAFLTSMNGFDTTLTRSEDFAMFFQVIMQGHKLVYEPASMLYHLHHRNYADLCKQIYYYGVNLTGQLTKNIFERPVLLLDLLSKVPYGLYFTLSGHSSKNRYKSVHYPKELTWLELKGMFYGPLAYLQSRRTLRHADQHSVASPSSFYHTMENSDHTFPYK